MKLVRFEPVRTLSEIAGQLDGLFQGLPTMADFGGSGLLRADIYEDEKHFFISMELPGVKKEDISVRLTEGNVLTISGKKSRSVDENDKSKYLRIERSYGSFSRSFTLPDIQPEGIAAEFVDGVLGIKLAKVEPKQPKEIAVEVA